MKSAYQEAQREKAIRLLNEKSPIFYGAVGGKYFMKKERDFVLTDYKKNFYHPIKDKVFEYFSENAINWWGGKNPTGHVLSSQVACINHLFAIRNDKNAVLGLLSTVADSFVDVLEINSDKVLGGFIQFEAVSNNDYLNEGQSTRGSNCTSIDALIHAKHKNGSLWLIPIEWKYTEFYNNLNKATEGCNSNPIKCKGIERQNRYKELINKSQQLNNENHYCYYFEPFYQLMRQTLWAEQMILHNKKETVKAENFLHIHIIPSENSDLLKQPYKCSGKDMETTWRSHLKHNEKYIIASPKDFLANLDKAKYEDLLSYLNLRYWQ